MANEGFVVRPTPAPLQKTRDRHLTAFPALRSGMLRDRRGDAAAIW